MLIKSIRRVAYVLGLYILLAGCQANPSVIENNAGTTIQTPAKTEMPPLATSTGNSSPSTQVSERPTPTPTLQELEPTITATPEIVHDFRSQLLMIDASDGTLLIFRSMDEEILDIGEALDFDPLPSGYSAGGDNYVISPTGAYFAFHRRVSDDQQNIFDESLVVLDHNFHIITSIPWAEDWRRIQRWLSDEWLLMRMFGDENDPRDPGPNRTIYNPFSNEQQVLTGIAPNLLDPCYGLPEWDPTLRYSYVPTDTPSVEGFQHVIWDSIEKRVVVSLDAAQGCPDGIQWSQRQEQIIIAIDKELTYQSSSNFFRLSFDGTVETLLDEADLSQRILIGKFVLSPDEKRIAYFFSVVGEGVDFNAPLVEHLAVLNIGTSEHFVYQDEFVRWDYEQSRIEYGYPVWSLNSRYVAVNYWVDEQTPEVLIIDTETGQKIWETEGDMIVLGWIEHSQK
jgi:hypothetical protein